MAEAIDWNAALGLAPAEIVSSAPFGSLVWRPSVYSRNGVSWVSTRSWSASTKSTDLAVFKAHKALPLSPMLAPAADEMTAFIGKLIGTPGTVTAVACGHSKRSDCFGAQLAVAVADRLGSDFVQVFADRFVAGSSHPKEFRKLPPLVLMEHPPLKGLVLLVDDVATSGWHMEEALTRLRTLGSVVLGVAWISGSVRGLPSSDLESGWTATQ